MSQIPPEPLESVIFWANMKEFQESWMPEYLKVFARLAELSDVCAHVWWIIQPEVLWRCLNIYWWYSIPASNH